MSTPIILICGAAGSGKDTVAALLAQSFNGVCIAQADPMKRFVADVYQFSDKKLWGPSEERNSAQRELAYTSRERWKGADARLAAFASSWIKEVLPNLSIEEQKDAREALLNWHYSVREHYLAKADSEPTPRFILQTLGTEWGRNFSPTMWNDYAIAMAKKLLSGGVSYTNTQGLKICEGKDPERVIITDGRFKNEIVGVKAVGGFVVRVSNPSPGHESAQVDAAGVKGHKSEAELNGVPASFIDFEVLNDKRRGLLAIENLVVNCLGKDLFRNRKTSGSYAT